MFIRLELRINSILSLIPSFLECSNIKFNVRTLSSSYLYNIFWCWGTWHYNTKWLPYHLLNFTGMLLMATVSLALVTVQVRSREYFTASLVLILWALDGIGSLVAFQSVPVFVVVLSPKECEQYLLSLRRSPLLAPTHGTRQLKTWCHKHLLHIKRPIGQFSEPLVSLYSWCVEQYSRWHL